MTGSVPASHLAQPGASWGHPDNPDRFGRDLRRPGDEAIAGVGCIAGEVFADGGSRGGGNGTRWVGGSLDGGSAGRGRSEEGGQRAESLLQAYRRVEQPLDLQAV